MPLLNDSPLANEQLSVSQGLIRTNFQLLGPCVGGIFKEQAVGGLGTLATELAIYNKVVGAFGNQLCFRRAGIGVGGAEIPFTIVSNTLTNYTAILPSGIIVKFGRGAIGLGTNDFNITYDANNPLTNLFYRSASYDFGGTAAPGAAIIVTATAIDYTLGLQTLGIRIAIRPNQAVAGRFYNYIAVGN
jgi:hypothetical protein